MSPRAGIVVTGTEVLSGRVPDRNGPWLAGRLADLGVDLAHLAICGDRPEDIEAELRFMAAAGVDLIVTSGGLGPTADDLTAAVVARSTGRPLMLDERLERRIAEILRPLVERRPDLDPEAIRVSGRKQAMVPEGAAVIEPAGTAPGLVVPPADRAGPTVVVLPGPPHELRAMWPQAVSTRAFRAAVGQAPAYEQRVLRLFGIPESEIAATLRMAETSVPGLADLEVTTCMRRGELELAARYEPGASGAWERLRGLVAERHGGTLYSTDGTTVDEQVAALLEGASVAVGESCTGGLMAARLNERPGASAYFRGGVVAYSNAAKADLLGVDPGVIERHGAVSPEVADAMAAGALARFEAAVAVGITGVAGPGGGTEAKPVGYVCWSARRAGGAALAREGHVPGDRSEIRDRATTVGMHLLRRLLGGEAVEAVEA